MVTEENKVIKGCNKRVIVMKDTGNEMIEEAFFILRPQSTKSIFSEDDIMKHANSILETSYSKHFSSLSMNVTKNERGIGNVVHFLVGLAFGVVISAVIFFML